MKASRPGTRFASRLPAGVLVFVRAVAAVVGVGRIALIGSIVTAKPTPNDIDLLVTVTADPC